MKGAERRLTLRGWPFAIHGPEALALAGILALAAILRLGWPGLTEFKSDEAHLFTLALDLVELKSFSWCGIGSSVGLANSPVSVYLTALPLVSPWMRNPIGGVLWVGALNTLAVLACYLIGRRYWGVAAGLIAALLFAAAPWAVVYSRKIWAQNYLPLFTLAYIGAALLAVVEGRGRWFVAHTALLAILIQLHLAAIAFVPLTALVSILSWRQVGRRWLAAGAVIGALAFLPYAGCISAKGVDTAAATLARLSAQSARVTADSLALSWLVTTGQDIHSLAGPQAFRRYLASVPNLESLSWLEGGLVLAGLAYWLARFARRPAEAEARAGLVAALWIVVPPLFFLRHSTEVFPHYFISLYPGPYLAAGALLGAALGRWQGRAARGLGIGIPAAIAAAQTASCLALLHFLATHATPDGFGTPAGMQASVAQGLPERLRRTGAAEVMVVSAGDDPAVHETPAIFDVWLRGLPHRFVNGDTTAVLPAGGAIVILAPGDRVARRQYLAWAGEGAPVETFPLRPGEGAYTRITLPASHGASPPHPADPPAALANGASILGYGWQGQAAPGGRVRWELWWQVVDDTVAPAGQTYHIFNHLVDGADKRWGQQDQASLPPGGWRVGDLMVSYFDLAVAADAAAGPYWVRAGMYTYPDIGGVSVLDTAGNPAGEAVRLGPLAER